MDEIVLGILGGLLILGFLLGMPIMLLVLYARTRRIPELVVRLEQLERWVRQQLPPVPSPPSAVEHTPWVEAILVDTPQPAPAEADRPVLAPVTILPRPSAATDSRSQNAAAWELFIGRQALGWLAVVVLLFATAFFLRYAFENEWIGPLGRVTLGMVAGLSLVTAGQRYLYRGWRVFSQMLVAAGVVLLYLSTYSAFGFYHLLPQREAGLFLFLVVVESMLLALRCESPAIALMAVLGGLLTPLLMHSEHDQYVSLFLYLAVLNVGVVGLLMRRAWPVVGTVSLLGTQALFWAWYAANYHPEKLAWAIAFQGALYLLFLGHALLDGMSAGRRATPEGLARFLINALFLGVAGYALLHEDYRDWLGSLAVAMAAVYALVTRMLLTSNKPDERLVLASLAVASGFMALAFPLQAGAPWVALGWAAEAGLLWWFGLRVESLYLRGLSAVFATWTVVRLLVFDTPPSIRAPFIPVFNRYALPALLAVACLLLALAAARRFAARLRQEERVLAALAAVTCVLLVWWILSVDIHGYFMAQQVHRSGEYAGRRLAQMSLSAWWATYAAIILAIGFRTRLSLLRWTALGLFAITVGKVFLFDMEGLDEIYRIVAFFVLAVLLGAAAWAYQRNQPDRPLGRSSEE